MNLKDMLFYSVVILLTILAIVVLRVHYIWISIAVIYGLEWGHYNECGKFDPYFLLIGWIWPSFIVIPIYEYLENM